MHTEITTPREKAAYKERQIVPPRNAEHGKRMERELHILRLDYLLKLKRVKLR